MNRFWGVVLLCAAMLTASSPSLAARKKPKPKVTKWVTLVHNEGEVPAGWLVGLRKAAEAAAPTRAWLDPPGLSLDEIQLTLGCASWGPSCAGQAAGLIGADNALVVDVTAKGDIYLVAIEAVSSAGDVVGEANEIEVTPDDNGRAIAEAWVSGAVKGTRPTVVIIDADQAGTEVVIDGAPSGVTPLVLIDTLAVGEHELLLRREGRAPLSRTFTVVAGTRTREFAALTQGPQMKVQPTVGETAPAPLPAPPPGSTSTMALVGFGLGGVGVAVAGVSSVVAGLAAQERQSFLDPDAAGETTRKGICVDGGVCTVGDKQFTVAEFRDYDVGLQNQVAMGIVGAAAGLLVAATGVVIGVAALQGEAADETVTGPAAATPSPTKPTPPAEAPAPAEVDPLDDVGAR